MDITKNRLKQIIKEEIEDLQENPFDEEDENPLVRAANDALFNALNAVEQLVFAMDEMGDKEKKTLYRGRVTMGDVKYKMEQLKRLLG